MSIERQQLYDSYFDSFEECCPFIFPWDLTFTTLKHFSITMWMLKLGSLTQILVGALNGPKEIQGYKGTMGPWPIAKSSVGRGGMCFTKVVCGISKNQN